MTNQDVAERIVKTVLELRKSGMKEDDEKIDSLMKKFTGTEDDFRWALEMISTGAFRAAIISSGKKYPLSN